MVFKDASFSSTDPTMAYTFPQKFGGNSKTFPQTPLRFHLSPKYMMSQITLETTILSKRGLEMASDKPELVIIGDGETAELAHDYFVRDNKYTVVGFSAEQAFMRHRTLLGLPVVAFEEIEHIFDPQKVTAFVAVSYTRFNRLRTRLFNLAKAKGYHFCSYISPQATISPEWKSAKTASS